MIAANENHDFWEFSKLEIMSLNFFLYPPSHFIFSRLFNRFPYNNLL